MKTSTVLILGGAAVGVYLLWSNRTQIASWWQYNVASGTTTPAGMPASPNSTPTAQAVWSGGAPIVLGSSGQTVPTPISSPPGFQPGTFRPATIRLGGGFVGANTLAPVSTPIANQQIFLPPLGGPTVQPFGPRIVR